MWRFGVLVGALTMACGSGPSLAYEELDVALQQARCTRAVRCELFPDEATCMAYFRIVPDPSIAAAIDADVLKYDGGRAKSCVDAIAQQSCDLTTADGHALPAACTEMFDGTIAGGDNCSFDAECASGTCNLPEPCPEKGCCVGTCRPAQSRAAAGGDCAKDRDCADKLVCGTDMQCHAPAAETEACGSDRECSDGLACIGANQFMPGACRKLPHAGEACPYGRCADENLRCDADTTSCVAVGLPGAACPKETECGRGFQCNKDTHACETTPQLGMPCTNGCAGDAFCSVVEGASAGTCVAPFANGSPCDGYFQCETFYCEQGPIFDSCKDPYICI